MVTIYYLLRTRLRSFGDLGLLLGAGSLGALAQFTSMEVAFRANAALLSAATLNMALRAKEPPRFTETAAASAAAATAATAAAATAAAAV